jgi:hypothetical protein
VIPYAEEVQAVLDVVADPQMQPNAHILVDKSNAQMDVTSGDVEPHIELIGQHLAKFGEPKVATVVSRDVDFGMTRMLEFRSEGRIQHQFRVFRKLEEAYVWLGVDPAAIAWP